VCARLPEVAPDLNFVLSGDDGGIDTLPESERPDEQRRNADREAGAVDQCCRAHGQDQRAARCLEYSDPSFGPEMLWFHQLIVAHGTAALLLVVEVFGFDHDVPAVQAVPAPVGSDITRLETEFGVWVADEKTQSAAIDADDGFRDVARLGHPGVVHSLSFAQVASLVMRVIAGTAGGRRLVAPSGTAVRPTADRVKESMFNRLESLGLVRDALVLDLFAGSGALGIEALSRGAASVTFVENDPAAIRAVRSNLETIGFVASLHRVSADRFLVANTVEFDLALLDPPYDFEAWSETLRELPAATAVIESSGPVELPGDWTVIKASTYGRTHVAVIERADGAPARYLEETRPL